MKHFIRQSILCAVIIALLSCDKDKPSPAPNIQVTASITTGTAGRVITLSSNHGFSSSLLGNVVKFNGTVATSKTLSADEIRVTAPDGGSTGPITITADGREIIGPVFTYVEPRTTAAYYFRYKSLDVPYDLTTSSEPLSTCSAGCVMSLLDVGGVRFILELDPVNIPKPGTFEKIEGTSFKLQAQNPPFAFIRRQVPSLNNYYESSRAGDGETLIITSVVYKRSDGGGDIYDVSGQFRLIKLIDYDKNLTHFMSDGTFLLPMLVKP